MRLLNFLFFILFATAVKAESVLGFDHLALLSPHYNLEKVIDSLPKDSAVGFLWRSFGTDLDRARRVLGSGKVKIVRVHLLNGAGLRNGQLAPYESLYGMTLTEFRKKIQKRDRELLDLISSEARVSCQRLALEFPDIRVLCSPVLEHNLSKREFELIREVVANAAPAAETVNNPVSQLAPKVEGSLHELHGYPGRSAELVSLDGAEPLKGETPASYAQKNKTAQVAFWWEQSMNCRTPGSFIPPRERTKCW
jgi:hypothetical protein